MTLLATTLQEPHPLGDTMPFYLIIETSGSNAEHDQAKLDQFLGAAMEEGKTNEKCVLLQHAVVAALCWRGTCADVLSCIAVLQNLYWMALWHKTRHKPHAFGL